MAKKKTTKKHYSKKTKKEATSVKIAKRIEGKTSLSETEEYKIQKELTTADDYYCINKNVLRRFGWEMTGFIAMFVSMSIYSYKTHPHYNGWFFYKRKDLCEHGLFNEKAIAQMKKELIESGLIEVRRKGIPSLEWYKINTIQLVKIYLPLEKTKELLNGQSRKMTPTEYLGKNISIEDAYQKYTAVGRDKKNTAVNEIIASRLNSDKSTNSAYGKKSTIAALYNTKEIAFAISISKDIDTANATSISSKEDTELAKAIYDRGATPTLSSSILINEPIGEIITYWNNLPNVTKHRLDQETKTIKSACEMLSALLQGRPIVHTKTFSPRKELKEFFHANSIDTKFMRKVWTVQEIQSLLRSAVEMRNKTGVNTKISLPNLLWNGFASRDRDGNKTAFSWFYYALTLQDTPPAFKDAAIKLAESLGNPHNKPITKWAHELYNFTKTMGDRESEVVPLLKWYLTHRKDLYMPVVRDMQEFVRKYEQILETRTRQRRYMGNRLFVDDPASVVLYDGKGRVIKSAPTRTTLEPIKLYNGRGQLIN